MIEINLLPEGLGGKKVKAGPLVPDMRAIVFLVAALVGLLVIVHLFFAGQLIIRKLQLKTLDKRWAQSSPQLQEVNAWKREHKISREQSEYINSLLRQRIAISPKLQGLLSAGPTGLWFNRLSIKDKEFNLSGSVVSLQAEHMRLLTRFLNQLKEDERFFADFSRLELGRMLMRTLGGYSVMDFALEGSLK